MHRNGYFLLSEVSNIFKSGQWIYFGSKSCMLCALEPLFIAYLNYLT